MHMPAFHTTLGGALCLRPDGYHWADGTPEPRAQPMRLADLAGNWRRTMLDDGSSVVELPDGWSRHVGHDGAHRAIAQLVLVHGSRARGGVGAEVPGGRAPGALVPLGDWDRTMNEIVGVLWDRDDEAAILATAERLRGPQE